MKFKTASNLVPQPVVLAAQQETPYGVIYFGSTAPAMEEAFDVLRQAGIELDAMRLRAFPFPDSVKSFIKAHKKVFVIEQNRDAQMHTLLSTELELDGTSLIKILHYDGTPITARFIASAIGSKIKKTRTSKPKKTKEITA